MLFRAAEAIIDCLDRASIRRIVRLDVEEIARKHKAELQEWERRGPNPPDPEVWMAMDLVVLKFLAHLQMKGRAALRRPAHSLPASGK